MRVQDVMTEDVQTISSTNAAEDAWALKRRHGFHHVVVTRGSRVVGVLSDRPVTAARRWTLKHRTPHRKRHTATGVW